MKATHLSKSPAKLNTTESKITAIENLRLGPRYRFAGLELDGNASAGDVRTELKDAVVEAFPAHLIRTSRQCWDWGKFP